MRQTDYVILGLLNEGPLTGYEIKQLINIRFKFFWSESYGQLYPALKSLKERGLIEETATRATSHRSQKSYRLEPKGLAALKDWLAQPVEKESVRLEILLKMYFSQLVDNRVMVNHLTTFQQQHMKEAELLRMFQKELKSILDQDPSHANILQVVNFGIEVNEAYLNWCREVIAFLKEAN